MTDQPIPASAPPARHLTTDDVEDIVRKTVTETLTALGLDVSSPEAIIERQADFAYLKKSRKGVDEVRKWVFRSAIGVAVTTVLYWVGAGFIAAVKAKIGG